MNRKILNLFKKTFPKYKVETADDMIDISNQRTHKMMSFDWKYYKVSKGIVNKIKRLLGK